MPQLSLITSTFFINLVNRLGIRPPPAQGFELSSIVQPVSIVDSDIQIPVAITTVTMDVPATAGEIVAPGIGATLADTGQLAVGLYNFVAAVGSDWLGVGTQPFRMSRRNAADAANVWTQIFSISSAGTMFWTMTFSARILANERIRILTAGASVAGNTVGANIWSQLIQ